MLARVLTLIVISVSTISFADAENCMSYGSSAQCRDKDAGDACTTDEGGKGLCAFSYFKMCECAAVKKPKKKAADDESVSKK